MTIIISSEIISTRTGKYEIAPSSIVDVSKNRVSFVQLQHLNVYITSKAQNQLSNKKETMKISPVFKKLWTFITSYELVKCSSTPSSSIRVSLCLRTGCLLCNYCTLMFIFSKAQNSAFQQKNKWWQSVQLLKSYEPQNGVSSIPQENRA